MTDFAPAAEQLEALKRGAVDLISEEELEKKLERSRETGKPLIVKVGFDPSAPDIHLGHTVVMRKMKQFQDLGHQIVFVVGDTVEVAVRDAGGQDFVEFGFYRTALVYRGGPGIAPEAHFVAHVDQIFGLQGVLRTSEEHESDSKIALGVRIGRGSLAVSVDHVFDLKVHLSALEGAVDWWGVRTVQ
ncbi:MAG: hypothetical protein IH849_16045, partial [Acidobacteria bacterium]|nr:hypothetical protein [Acidobacteriota bacterium]